MLASEPMDAAQALADLTEISSQIEAAVLFLEDAEAAQALAGAATALLERAGELRAGGDGVTQLEASTADGSVFVVRGDERRIAATTGPAPTVGLVFYDLKSCLRGAADDPPEPKRPRRRKAADEA